MPDALCSSQWVYAWLRRPFSKRAVEDKLQTDLLKEAWEDSGKVYGYRKLHDDLRDQGEVCCLNGVARLAKMAGIKRRLYKTRNQAKSDVFNYIEMFYNPKRKHVSNGMLSPIEFEKQQN